MDSTGACVSGCSGTQVMAGHPATTCSFAAADSFAGLIVPGGSARNKILPIPTTVSTQRLILSPPGPPVRQMSRWRAHPPMLDKAPS